MPEEKKNLYKEFSDEPLTKEARDRLRCAIREIASNSELERRIGVSNQTISNATTGFKTAIPTVILLALELSDDLGQDWLIEEILKRPLYRAAFLVSSMSADFQKQAIEYLEWRHLHDKEARPLNISTRVDCSKGKPKEIKPDKRAGLPENIQVLTINLKQSPEKKKRTNNKKESKEKEEKKIGK